ncbi:MAG: polysaccharide deacetylase family protein [Halanaerobiaceae bacterium]|jgi:peptidoglycan/xylan/chitin deacetylase (PgdA/CDA1 family)|nr:polysaccharide deacetylase family protein [Halanaerobiaceae bacterium]
MKISFSFYPEGRKKALTMSYDDGQIHDRRLVEIFNKYGIKGTFHLNSGTLDKEGFLKSAEIKELFRGHEIAVHSVNHPFLTRIPAGVLLEEIIEDRRRLEELAAYPVRGMSYPFGEYNDNLLNLLPHLGIEYSRTVQSHGSFRLPENFLAWHPTCHHEQDILEKFKEFQKPSPWEQLPLFYIWGHSFEFARNDNWDLIEEFCKIAGGDEETWYATNVEIMDYIKALRGLKISVDQKIVYNPSAIPVWISADGEAVKIEAGEKKILQ